MKPEYLDWDDRKRKLFADKWELHTKYEHESDLVLNLVEATSIDFERLELMIGGILCDDGTYGDIKLGEFLEIVQAVNQIKKELGRDTR